MFWIFIKHVFKSNCFRDSKQFTGLTNCQSRNVDKLHFHSNAPLASVNLAKVKALGDNVFLMQRFISVLGMNRIQK